MTTLTKYTAQQVLSSSTNCLGSAYDPTWWYSLCPKDSDILKRRLSGGFVVVLDGITSNVEDQLFCLIGLKRDD